MDDNLWRSSIAVILENQTPSGAYLASPNFPTYHYCWFRDGAFIAYAMDVAGEHESAARFHTWGAAAINSRAAAIARAIASGQRGEVPAPTDLLHTRYTADGEAGGDEWPNFQLDGLGTWLWALGEHVRLSELQARDEWLAAAGLAADYLAALWPLPCYDCWEEFPDKVHPHTLAAIYGGLTATERLTGRSYAGVREVIRSFLLSEGVCGGRFVKYVGADAVDASLLGLAVPYGIVAPDDPVIIQTVKEIQASLLTGGGVHRYLADTYYGGGQWILLTAWLGWYMVEVGRVDEAALLLAWVEGQATPEGWLPEQIPQALNDPAYYEPWRGRWGDIACPLLWSHAKYIIGQAALRRLG